jgi:hypothetical protein
MGHHLEVLVMFTMEINDSFLGSPILGRNQNQSASDIPINKMNDNSNRIYSGHKHLTNK